MADKELVGIRIFSFSLKNFSTIFQKIKIRDITKFLGAIWLFFLKGMVI